jgi:hypothetical protein
MYVMGLKKAVEEYKPMMLSEFIVACATIKPLELDSYSSKTKNGRELKHILEILIRYDIALE